MYILNELEEELKRNIEELIEDGDIAKAKEMITSYEQTVNKIVILSMKRKIAKAEGNENNEKRLIDILLELEPDNVKLMSRGIKIARDEGDIETEKKLLDREIELEPDNIIPIRSRAIIAKREGDLEREKILLDMCIKLDPYDVKLLKFRVNLARKLNEIEKVKQLIKEHLDIYPNDVVALTTMGIIAIKEGDYESQKIYTERILKLDPRNKKAREWKKRLRRKGIIVEGLDKEILERAKVEKSGKPIVEIRRLMYESKDIVKVAEEVKERLDGLDELTREIILAELYYTSGVPLRAERSLKSYKKKLESDENSDKRNVKLVRAALELVKGTRTKKYNWDDLWQKREENEQGEDR